MEIMATCVYPGISKVLEHVRFPKESVDEKMYKEVKKSHQKL